MRRTHRVGQAHDSPLVPFAEGWEAGVPCCEPGVFQSMRHHEESARRSAPITNTIIWEE